MRALEQVSSTGLPDDISPNLGGVILKAERLSTRSREGRGTAIQLRVRSTLRYRIERERGGYPSSPCITTPIP